MSVDPDTEHPFSERRIDLAASNYEAQLWLVNKLQEAFVMSGRTKEDLADELGLSMAETDAWLDGEIDLTLAELRHLANSVDAKVSYNVGPLKTRYIEKFADLEDSQWRKSPWVLPAAV